MLNDYSFVHLLKTTFNILLVLMIWYPVECFAVGRWNSGEILMEHCNATLKLKDTNKPTHEDHIKSVGCLSYLEGIKQMLYEENSIALQKNICFPEIGISNSQASRIVINFLEDHPEKLREQKLNITLEAFAKAFPCE